VNNLPIVRRQHSVASTIVLTLTGPEADIIPKARPRVPTIGRAYMPAEYVAWKRQAILSLQEQWKEMGRSDPLNTPARISVQIEGKYRRSRDSDNTDGAVLDAMVQAGILQNDNLKWVPGSSADLFYSKKDPLVVHIFVDVLEAGAKSLRVA